MPWAHLSRCVLEEFASVACRGFALDNEAFVRISADWTVLAKDETRRRVEQDETHCVACKSRLAVGPKSIGRKRYCNRTCKQAGKRARERLCNQ